MPGLVELQYAVRLYKRVQENLVPVNRLQYSEVYASTKPL